MSDLMKVATAFRSIMRMIDRPIPISAEVDRSGQVRIKRKHDDNGVLVYEGDKRALGSVQEVFLTRKGVFLLGDRVEYPVDLEGGVRGTYVSRSFRPATPEEVAEFISAQELVNALAKVLRQSVNTTQEKLDILTAKLAELKENGYELQQV